MSQWGLEPVWFVLFPSSITHFLSLIFHHPLLTFGGSYTNCIYLAKFSFIPNSHNSKYCEWVMRIENSFLVFSNFELWVKWHLGNNIWWVWPTLYIPVTLPMALSFFSLHAIFFLSTLFSSFFLHQSYFLYRDLGCRSRDLYVDVFGFGWVYWCGCGLRLGLWWRWVCVAVRSFFFLWVWLIMWVGVADQCLFLLRFMWVATFVCNLWSSSFIAMAGSSFWYKSHQLMRNELRKKLGIICYENESWVEL